ncbi:flagellar hook-length control protein FliK [Paucimonas lemoignei]|uniref:Flagellar hook-length control protein FliK n=1 Tax=Paucimonas lemoignei TaxID=29443 RepID=A0A4V2UJ91_PAULE|nr:flagellar hook-length control protein FliK [Paucimonas lemoignei]TCS39190.1 flagellar hook-length control protein FliK [Paucimonas lemoignei]
MLPRADSLGSRPLAYVEAPAPVGSSTDARQESYHRLNQIALGQQVPAKVLERLPDGTFLVRVADASARMSLPVGAKVGDDLSMTLVERQPRPTFLLGGGAASLAGDAPATLSQAARLIDSLLQAAQRNGAATAAIGRTPLLPSSAMDAGQLAASLQDAADGSGIFYESHLAQWAAGNRSLASVLREPQAAQNGTAKADGATDAALLRHLAGQWIGNGRSLSELASELHARAGNVLQPGMENGALNSQAAQLIHAQLNSLETQRFVWQGELWPGQKLEWEVERDEHGAQQGKQEPQENWQSAVRLELPALGEVSATIHLKGNKVSILVRAGTADSAALLRAHGPELALALEAAGSPLEALIVNQDDQA